MCSPFLFEAGGKKTNKTNPIEVESSNAGQLTGVGEGRCVSVYKLLPDTSARTHIKNALVLSLSLSLTHTETYT